MMGASLASLGCDLGKSSTNTSHPPSLGHSWGVGTGGKLVCLSMLLPGSILVHSTLVHRGVLPEPLELVLELVLMKSNRHIPARSL